MSDGNAVRRVFLRKVLYRIDYQLISVKVFEDLYDYVSRTLGDKFEHREETSEKNLNFEIYIDKLEESRLNQSTDDVYMFTTDMASEKDGLQLGISRTYIFLEISLGIKNTNNSYFQWFADIIEYFKQNKIYISRVGLRKFNSFYMKDSDICNLNNIFNIEYLPKVDQAEHRLVEFEDNQTYICKDRLLKFHKSYNTGYLKLDDSVQEGERAHLIAFDFDLFSNNPDSIKNFIMNPEQELTDMHAIIFDFFSNIVKEPILELINSGDMLSKYKVIPLIPEL